MTFWFWRRYDEGKYQKLPAQTVREPILAYRSWRISDLDLISCTCECIWQPRRRMSARCSQVGLLHDARAPVWDCSCGFYAYKAESSLSASEYLTVSRGLTVGGRVAFWGRVVDHEIGYRAEHAYPQVLYLRGEPRYDEVVKRLADRYAIECVPKRLTTI
jgi:hypothetical protein